MRHSVCGFWTTLLLVAVTACSSLDDPEPLRPPPAADARAIAEAMVAGLREGMQAFRDAEAQAAPPLQTLADPVACQPDRLIPPVPCAEGGDIRTTVNLRCEEPTGCCGNDPPCLQDEAHVGGQIGLLFNRCRLRSDERRIEMHGSLTGNLTVDSVFQCNGAATTELLLTYLGRPSVTIDGREACPGTISLTVRAFVDTEISLVVTGNVCEVPVSFVYEEGCVQDCPAGHCCYAGSACGTISEGACFAPGYTVDCGGGRACPTGSTCIDGGEQCAF